MSSGKELLEKANKKANSTSSSFLGFGASSTTRQEEAHDLYNSAANSFKLEKKWKESGDAFSKAGETALKINEKDDAINDFWNASKSYKRAHPELAVAALSRTITLLTEKGRFRQAADRQKEIGQIYQQDGGDLRAAMDAYEQAGEWYASEDANATANACFKDVAELAAFVDPPDWAKAIERFEQVADASLKSPLTKYSVKEYYLKAALCHLATGDDVSTERALGRYVDMDNTFSSTREYKFLEAILLAWKQGDTEVFTNEVAQYDSLTKLDNWKTSVLLQIKRGIQAEPGLT